MEKINKKKVFVFLDVSIDGDPLERLTFELFTDVAPKTAENFRALCTGEKGVSPKTGKPLHYKGTFFHRIIKGFVAQAGDFLRQDGNYGESIYGGNFPDESPKLKHDSPGLLSMAIADLDERGSLFSITFKADHHLDRKNIVFGELVDGHEVLKKIENAGDDEGRPSVTVKIVNSGELYDDKMKGKRGKDAVEGNNHEVKHKGKHKKNSNKRRKRRRRYYTSESDSSTDSDMDSSESDTGSDSYASSLSDTSSSSDDRCKKRRRSKRGRHRRGKKMDRRHEKRRKRRDKKSKHKRYCRQSVSNGENDSQSGGSSQDIGKHKASVEEQENAKVHHRKREAADTSEREEGEFPRENGDHQSNGVGMRMESDRSANGGPDVVDNLPSKSRSRSLSPRRTPSRTTSISPRNADRSPGVGAKHNRNGTLTVSRSPQQQISGRSRSNTPVRSGNSRSPAENRRGRNVSMSPPARSHSQRSPSRSATVSPSRRRVAHGPPRSSSRRSASRSASGSPVRSSRRSLRSSSKPSRKSISRSPLQPSHRSVSRSSGRAPPKRSPSPSPVRAPRRINRRSYSRSPVSAARRVRSPVSDRRRSLSRSPVNGSPKHVRRGRVFNDRYSYAHRYGRSPDRSPVRSYRYGGRSDRNRYSSYRRSPRRYGSPPPRGRTPPRYRSRRSRSRSPSVSRSPIRYRNRHYSRSWSPIHSRSPVGRYHSARTERRRSPSGSRSPSQSKSRSPRDSQLPRNAGEGNSRSSSGSPRDWQSPKSAGKGNSRLSSGSPPRKSGLVSYEDGSPDSGGS